MTITIPPDSHGLDGLVYVRQSKPMSGLQNEGSAARQFALVQAATTLGWPASRITVVDDRGRSAINPGNRPKFDQMLSRIQRGEIGIFLAVDGQRVARNRVEWALILSACEDTHTLMYINGKVFDPTYEPDMQRLERIALRASTDFRMVMKSLHMARHAKVRAGTMRIRLPAGLNYLEGTQVIKDPDERVQGALMRVFDLFECLGSTVAVTRQLREEETLIPRRSTKNLNIISWEPATTSTVLSILHNPAYAGARAYFRTVPRPRGRSSNNVHSKSVTLPNPEQWGMCQQDIYEGYITWDQYLANRARLKSNSFAQGIGAPREGAALLQGLVQCGVCGHRMFVDYQKNKHQPIYVCTRLKRQIGGPRCQAVAGEPIELAVSTLLLDVLAPANAEYAAHLAATQHQNAQQARKRYTERRRELRQSTVEAQQRLSLALKARMGEARVEELTHAWEAALNQRDKHDEAAPATLDSHATDLPTLADTVQQLWHDPATPHEHRKVLLRSLIRQVEIHKDSMARVIHVVVHWQGTGSTSITLGEGQYRFRTKVPKELNALVRELALTLDPEGIADYLNTSDQWKRSNWSYNESQIRQFLVSPSQPAPETLPKDHLTLRDCARLLGIAETRAKVYFPRVPRHLTSPRWHRYHIVHLPSTALPELQSLFSKRGQNASAFDCEEEFIAQKMTDDTWGQVKPILYRSVQDPDAPELARDVIDHMLWMHRHHGNHVHLIKPRMTRWQYDFHLHAWHSDGRLHKLLTCLANLCSLPGLVGVRDLLKSSGKIRRAFRPQPGDKERAVHTILARHLAGS
ncbi:recombinase family protein [Deinococcus oregonensis]|uniref:Recombinase family protein n=1 Tax=Deinococcus oregonensis TaxID=1805970 RepID=A0ABV6AVX0_9DEIO